MFFFTFLHKKLAVRIHQLSSQLEISVTTSDFHVMSQLKEFPEMTLSRHADTLLVECLAVVGATQFVSNQLLTESVSFSFSRYPADGNQRQVASSPSTMTERNGNDLRVDARGCASLCSVNRLISQLSHCCSSDGFNFLRFSDGLLEIPSPNYNILYTPHTLEAGDL